jgi:hypothetical protein
MSPPDLSNRVVTKNPDTVTTATVGETNTVVEGLRGEPQTKTNVATGKRAATAKGDIKRFQSSRVPGARILITEREGLFNSKQPSRAQDVTLLAYD